MTTHIEHDHQDDGVDRKGFLKCMAWAGTGVLWTLSGGKVAAKSLGDHSLAAKATTSGPAPDFSFVQISDSHVGFPSEGQYQCRRHV